MGDCKAKCKAKGRNALKMRWWWLKSCWPHMIFDRWRCCLSFFVYHSERRVVDAFLKPSVSLSCLVYSLHHISFRGKNVRRSVRRFVRRLSASNRGKG